MQRFGQCQVTHVPKFELPLVTCATQTLGLKSLKPICVMYITNK